jgi:hypothetical protein
MGALPVDFSISLAPFYRCRSTGQAAIASRFRPFLPESWQRHGFAAHSARASAEDLSDRAVARALHQREWNSLAIGASYNDVKPPCMEFSHSESFLYSPAAEASMDDTKQSEEQQGNQPKKPLADQVTDLLATAAGALAETAVKSVAKRVRKTAAKKTPKPVKKAVRAIGKAAKAPKKTAKKAAKKTVKKAVKKTKKTASKKASKKKAKKSKSRRR